MPASKPSRLPSKKRRASSASGSTDETVEKETPRSSESMIKEQPAVGNPNEAVTPAIPSISQRRLPSKKRKTSHDSSQQSNQAAPARADNGADQGQTPSASNGKDDVIEQSTESKLTAGEESRKGETKSPVASVDSHNQSPEQKQRRNSVERHGGASRMRRYSNDGVSSTGSSPARARHRTASQTGSDLRSRKQIRSGPNLPLDSLSRPRARSNSQSSVASMDDALAKRKLSQDSGIVDFLGSARKESNDTTHSFKLDALLDLPPPEPIDINPAVPVPVRPRSGSTASLVNEGASGGGAAGGGGALAHLDALGEDAKPAAKKRSGSTDDQSSAAETFASSGHRVLMEAIKLSTGEEAGSKGSSQDAGLQPRTRLESWGAIGRERLGSIGSVLEASAFPARGRDRLESWGGMSDISVNLNASAGGNSGDRAASAAAAAAAAAAAVAEQFDLAGAGEDLAALGLLDDHNRLRANSVPSRISVGRDRFNSIASFSDNSVLPEGAEVTIDLNSIVAAAMAHVGDLAELAGVVETVAGVGGEARGRSGSDASSVDASPIIGAFLEGAGKKTERRQRPRSSSTSSKMSVDYEALAAAVDAAHAVSGNLDLDKLNENRVEKGASDNLVRKEDRRHHLRRQLPLKRDREKNEDFDESSDGKGTVSEKEMDRIRKRARLATASSQAGQVDASTRKKKSVPIKKRVKRQSSSPPEMERSASSPSETPRVSNRAIASAADVPDVPLSSSAEKPSKGQASQKWDSMYEALLAYIEERRSEETTDFSEEEKKEWTWDGNVPTTFKSADGKALGRWVNNQRSAKSKGTLKADREERLIQAGLKWSVLASNSWNETLEELRNYIAEQTRDGKEWDGNVPTHYQIKAKPNGKFAGEDKNLGRWVNRQRSMYQAGKLRKDRQAALEKLGLKWSMLSSTSWEAMYETLQAYVEERKNKEGSWDGNVPANYRTADNPPRALGRWINRQRSAFTKGKLKLEYVDKLNEIGLKWSVHEKNSYGARVAQTKSSVFLGKGESVSEESKTDVGESFVKAKTSATLSV